MSDKAVQFKASIDITGLSEEHVTNYCILHLRDRGYSVKAPSEKSETIKAFIARMDISYDTLYRALDQPDCPRVAINRGNRGRMISIHSNDDFEAFVVRNKA